MSGVLRELEFSVVLRRTADARRKQLEQLERNRDTADGYEEEISILTLVLMDIDSSFAVVWRKTSGEIGRLYEKASELSSARKEPPMIAERKERDVAAWIFGGTGVSFGILWGILLAVSEDNYAKYNAATSADDAIYFRKSTQTLDAVTTVSGISAIVALGVSTFLFLYGGRPYLEDLDK